MSTIELKNIWSRSNFEFPDCSNCILDVFAEIFSYIWAGLFLRHVVGCWGSSCFYIVSSSFYNCFWIQSLYIHIWQVFIFFIELTFVHFKWTVFIQWMHSKRLILAICRLFWFTFMTWAWIGFNISRSQQSHCRGVALMLSFPIISCSWKRLFCIAFEKKQCWHTLLW